MKRAFLGTLLVLSLLLGSRRAEASPLNRSRMQDSGWMTTLIAFNDETRPIYSSIYVEYIVPTYPAAAPEGTEWGVFPGLGVDAEDPHYILQPVVAFSVRNGVRRYDMFNEYFSDTFGDHVGQIKQTFPGDRIQALVFALWRNANAITYLVQQCDVTRNVCVSDYFDVPTWVPQPASAYVMAFEVHQVQTCRALPAGTRIPGTFSYTLGKVDVLYSSVSKYDPATGTTTTEHPIQDLHDDFSQAGNPPCNYRAVIDSGDHRMLQWEWLF